MKVIDLLNKIANEEKVPKKIMYKDEIYTKNKYNFTYWSKEESNTLQIDTFDLKKEIRIIEEDKEIEKLERINGSYLVDLRSDNSIEEQSEAITNLIIYLNNNVDKINELVKAVNELKKGK